jgi:hypothetical protein
VEAVPSPDQNLEIAREGIGPFSASDIDGLAELYTPDAFWDFGEALQTVGLRK